MPRLLSRLQGDQRCWADPTHSGCKQYSGSLPVFAVNHTWVKSKPSLTELWDAGGQKRDRFLCALPKKGLESRANDGEGDAS